MNFDILLIADHDKCKAKLCFFTTRTIFNLAEWVKLVIPENKNMQTREKNFFRVKL